MTTPPVKWTEEEDAILLEFYLTHERTEIAHMLGRTIGSVRKRCSVLGLNHKRPALTNEQLEFIRAWYTARQDWSLEEFDLDTLADAVGMNKTDVCYQAKKMGLTVQGRPAGASLRQVASDRMKAWYQENEHPRGNLGNTHDEQTREKMSIARKARQERMTPEEQQSMTTKGLQTKIAKYGTGNPGAHSGNPYSRTKSGKREDLGGQFFRSSWEANYARYLNWLMANGSDISAWEFEPETFVFEGIKRGTLSYTPDFKLTMNDGSVEWHEVKGWMDDKSKVRLKRFAKYYPSETLVLIDAKVYRQIAKSVSGMIAGWE